MFIMQAFLVFMKTRYSKTRVLVEGALMIALSTILSNISLFNLPHGGSITLVSMFPIILMSFRNGPRWGLLTAFVHSLLQLMTGLDNLAYCQTLSAQIGCVLFDYILAFTALGLASMLARPFKSSIAKIGMGTLGACLLRFLCSFISGYVVWKDYDYAFSWLNNFSWAAWATQNLGENALCWFYSLVYNASYMLPEAIITVVAALLMYRAIPQLFNTEK